MAWRKRLAVLALASVFASSCGSATYPKERVAEALVNLCRSEYGIEIKAQRVNTTLGVVAPIPGLVDAMRRSAGSSSGLQLPGILVEGRYTEKAFDFRVFARGQFTRVKKEPEKDSGKPKEPEAPLKKLQQVSTALHRVCLSTNAPLEFYQLIARDPGPEKLDVIFSGHVMDSKRIQFYDISMEELQARSQFSVRIQPEALAEQTVTNFFRDLRRLTLPKLLSLYTAPSQRFGEILPKMLSVAAELKGDEERLLDQKWFTRQIDRETVLVVVPLKVLDKPGALLFTVLIRENAGSFVDIAFLQDGILPEKYRPLGLPEHWVESFFLEPLSLPDFLADQIAKRVMGEFKPMGEEEKGVETAKKPPVRRPKEQEKPATPEEVTRVVVETAAYVVQSYEFKSFQKLSIVDALRGTRWAVPAADLPLYRRRNPPDLKPIP